MFCAPALRSGYVANFNGTRTTTTPHSHFQPFSPSFHPMQCYHPRRLPNLLGH
ncbi:hypothetical protein BJV78DRAFT_1247396, partial [Lactifluus subvellereus]